MGLDSFSSDNEDDDEGDSNTTSSSDSTSSGTSSGGVNGEITDPIEESDMTFYGTGDGNPGTTPMERKGAMSNHSMADLAKTADGDMVFEEDLLKFHLPVFTLITREWEYESGQRYNLLHDKDEPKASWNGKVVACIGCIETRLGNMNKEVAMYDAGSHSKKRVMDTMKGRLGDDVTADTTVYINFFGDAFFMRDLAQANEEYRAGELLDSDKVIGKVIKPKQLRVALEQRGDEDGDSE